MAFQTPIVSIILAAALLCRFAASISGDDSPLKWPPSSPPTTKLKKFPFTIKDTDLGKEAWTPPVAGPNWPPASPPHASLWKKLPFKINSDMGKGKETTSVTAPSWPLASPPYLKSSPPVSIWKKLPFKNRRLLQSGGVSMQFDGGQNDHLTVTDGNSVTIKIDPQGTARARSAAKYPLGSTITAQVKCASGDLSGIVTGFYISSDEGGQAVDEVDFEFVANDKSRVQTNYFVSGTGQHEEYVTLGSDCSSGFKTFSIEYGATTQFKVDGVVVRQASGFSKSVYIYVIGWWGGDPYWVGTATWANQPYLFQVNGITVS